MKRNKQRRAEIKHKRMTSRQDLEEQLRLAATPEERRVLIDKARRKRLGVMPADYAVLTAHNNALSLPEYYVDKPFICQRCGASEVWTAEQQKWWYEVAHGSIHSGANTCRKCRQAQRAQVANDPMHVQAEQLRALGAHKPTPAADAAVQAALKSKWEGMQVIAIDVLGAWWGLTGDGERLFQSDGSHRLRLRDPESFAEIGVLAVHDGERPVSALNELEWAGGRIYANRWMVDEIAVIDPETGQIVARIDASGLLTPAEAMRADVLNGIAWDPDRELFYLTGKYWPKLFAVRWIVPSEAP